MNDDELLTLGVIVLAWKLWNDYTSTAVPSLEQGGVKAYEWIHDDEGHKQDLPEKPWKIDRIIDLAADLHFPDPELAAAIAMAESGGVPNGKGDYRDGEFISYGLWQINIRAHPQFEADEMMDPLTNAKAAFEISKGGKDWSPWSTWWEDASRRIGPGRGRYLNFYVK